MGAPSPTPARASADPLSPPQGWLPALPGAQQQSPRLGDRTPRFPAPPHAHAPVSLVTQKGGFSALPPGKRKKRKWRGCWEVLGRQVLS